jgi:D-aspartate ligase
MMTAEANLLMGRGAERRRLKKPIGAVVVGGDYQGLGIVRSLGRQNVPVCVIDDETSIAFFAVRQFHVESVFSREDPLPGLVELALLPYLSVKRGF